MKITFHLNGNLVKAETVPGQTLMEYLRSQWLYSVKHGCDHGECGTCTVLIDGKAQNACLLMMHTVENRTVETLERLGSQEVVQKIQRDFLEEGAIQCGYCTPGMILSAVTLLNENPKPSEDEIRDALTGNLCRCTGYVKPVKAISK